MSASKQKRIRHDLNKTQGKKTVKNGLSKLAKNIIGGVSLFLAIVLVAGIIITSSGLLEKNLSALTVADESITVAEYNFNYSSNIRSFINNYSSYLPYIGFDTTKSLSSQTSYFDQNKTWADYFKEQTLGNLQTSVALCSEAAANNVTLTQDDKDAISKYIDSINTASKSNNQSVGSYLSKNFGKGVTVEVVQKALERIYLAQRYIKTKTDSFKYTDTEISDFYTKNKDDYDVVSYRSFLFPVDASATSSPENSTEENEKAAADAKAAVKAKADAMLAEITDEATFIAAAKKYAEEADKETYEDEKATLKADTAKSALTEEKEAEWLFDAARAAGNKTVLETASGYEVIYFISRVKPEYNVVNVRHILIQPEMDTGATTASDEQKAAAKATAEEIYNTWKSGEKTEESFAELAKEKTQDTGSASTGGLYENVYKGQMVAQFNDWCFDSARKAGDTGIVDTDYGSHIMYFVGFGKAYWYYQVNNKMVSDAYQAYQTELVKNFTVKENSFGMYFTEKDVLSA